MATLTPKQAEFVRQYLIDLNATQAAIRAGYSARTAHSQGERLLRHVEVAAALTEAQGKRAAKTEITAEKVLERYWMIATANPNDLVQHRRHCCRHCFGEGFAYQWIDEKEFEKAIVTAQVVKGPAPTDEGGYGYDDTIRPHPKCPKCHGEGQGEVFANDTRDLSPAALALYAGVKTTRDGMEIKLHDQVAALNMVAKHLGMFTDKTEITGANGGPIAFDGTVKVSFADAPERPDDNHAPGSDPTE